MSCISVATLAENVSFLHKYADFEARIRFGIGFLFFLKFAWFLPRDTSYVVNISVSLDWKHFGPFGFLPSSFSYKRGAHAVASGGGGGRRALLTKPID